MCGIAGIVAADQLDADDPHRLEAMRDSITHRGPDDAGLRCDAQAALGAPPPEHRRSRGRPSAAGQRRRAASGSSSTARSTTTPNCGRQLESLGHVYRTRSDTETIVHAYEQWGEACVERFRGMFAFAIWDAPRRRLFLARDRMGIKPLYWAMAGSRLLFGSEIKAILASGLVRADADERAIPELLSTRYVSGEQTLFKGINRLLPGHVLTFEHGAVKTRQWWDVPVGIDNPSSIAAVRRMPRSRGSARGLEDAVRTRLMADVPLGMFLSGGLDSSAIAALMAGHDRPAAADLFASPSASARYSELDYARQVSRSDQGGRARDRHRRARFLRRAAATGVARGRAARPSIERAALFRVEAGRRARQGRADRRGQRRAARRLRQVPARARQLAGSALWNVTRPSRCAQFVGDTIVPRLPGRLARYARRSFLAVARTPEAMFFDNFASIGLQRQATLLAPELAALVSPAAYSVSRAYFDKPNGHSTILDRLLYADLKTYLVELLMKQDQMSMAASIESRVPFLDHHLVEFAAALPAADEAARLHDQVDPARGRQGHPAAGDPVTQEDGFPGAVRALDARRGRQPARDVLLGSRRRGSAASSTFRRGDGADRRARRRPRRQWRRALEPAEPRALVSHLHRRRGRADAADFRVCAADPRAIRPAFGPRHEAALAQRQSPAAARQGGQAADVARHAQPRRAATTSPTCRSKSRPSRRPIAWACARSARELVTVPRSDPAKGTWRFYADAGATCVDPVPYGVAKYRSRAYRAPGGRAARAPAVRRRGLRFPAAASEFARAAATAPRFSSPTMSKRRSGAGTPRTPPTRRPAT